MDRVDDEAGLMHASHRQSAETDRLVIAVAEVINPRWNKGAAVTERMAALDQAERVVSIIAAAQKATWEHCAKEAHDLGWLHDWALSDLLARNPYRVIPPGKPGATDA